MQICKLLFIFTEPDRQFALVKEHIAALKANLYRTVSKVKIYVERNLGFEAEHHHRALGDIPGVQFYVVRVNASVPVIYITNKTTAINKHKNILIELLNSRVCIL